MHFKFFKLVIFAILILVFNSCEKDNCQNCRDVIDWTWDNNLDNDQINALNLMYQLQGYDDATDYYSQSLGIDTLLRDSQEYCGDALDDMQSLPEIELDNIAIISVECN